MAQVDPLSNSLEIAGAFSNTGVPVEIVEAENQGVGTVLSSNNNGGPQGGVANPPNVGGEEAMDISVEGDQNLDSTQLSAVPKAVEVPVPRLTPDVTAPNASGATVVTLPNAFPAISNAAGGASSVATNTASISTQVSSVEKTQTPAVSTANEASLSEQLSGQTAEIGSVSDHLQRVSSSAMALSQLTSGHPPALEIATDAISSLPNLGQLGAQDSQFENSMNFSGLDMSGTSINASGALDPESPSSPESNFDTSDLLSSSLLQQDEVTHRLTQAGPIGVAAAAAIMSGRKRKRPMTFETNPSLRKRHCSKLSKKLKETIDEMSMRVGLQAVVVMYKPGKANSSGSENSKNEPSFKVFGAAPLSNVVKNQKEAIVAEMEAALHQQTPSSITQSTPKIQASGELMHDLPPLVFDGIPTPVHKMTQAQLRTFIPNMLKSATGRGKPGWGKEDVKPPWWPMDVPWANVRSDIRTDEQKKQLPWTDALRRIVISCYIHHHRIDLLPEFSVDQLQQIFSPESTQQMQLQLESFQQQANPATSADSAETVPVSSSLSDVNTAPSGGGSGGGEQAPTAGILASDNQQVFTVDTGVGSCDTTGMPTLADASLAETAARLQQVADDTGEVQYATQTVTVTERDAKALGQPVGSTTTVLLTAYPGGHSGAAGTEATTAAQPVSDQLITTQQTSTSTNVQVVYSASHIDSIGTSAPSSSSTSQSGGGDTFTSTLASSGVAPEVTSVNATAITTSGGDGAGGGGVIPATIAATTMQQPTPMDTDTAATISDLVGGTEYLNPTQAGDGAEMMVGGATTGGDVTVGGAAVNDANEGDAPSDLATQLINQYSSVEDGTAATSEVAAAFEASKPAEAVAIATTDASQAPNTIEN